MTNELLLYLLLLQDEKHLLSLHLQCLGLGECSLNEWIILKYCLLHANSRYLHLSLPEVPLPSLYADPCVPGKFRAQRKPQMGSPLRVENSADALSGPDHPSLPPPTATPQTSQRKEKGRVKTILNATANSAGVWRIAIFQTQLKPNQGPEKCINVPQSNRAHVA